MGVVVSNEALSARKPTRPGLQPVHEADQLAGKPPEAVEVKDHQHVASPEVVQARLEAGRSVLAPLPRSS